MSAIPTDVQAPAVAATEPQEAVKSPRELAMEALESRHHESMAAENGFQLDAEPAPPPVAAPAVTNEDQLAAQMADQAVTAAVSPNVGSVVKIKIDGEESEVPLDDVVRQYQKNASADKRLAEATRLLREAQEQQARMQLQQQQEAQLAQQYAAEQARQQQDPPNNADTPPIAESGKEFLKALFEGDEENALLALQKVMEGRQGQQAPAPTLDINQLTQAVTQQVQHRVVIDSVLEANKRDYPELYADSDIEELAAQKIARLRDEQGMDFVSALTTVSADFAKKFGWEAARTEPGRTAPVATPTANARSAKLDQKRQIDNVASISTKTLTPDTQPEDPSSVIAQMRAARGGG